MKRILSLSMTMLFLATALFAGGAAEEVDIEDFEPNLDAQFLWPEDELGAQPEFPELAGQSITLTLSAFSDGQIRYLQEWAANFEELYGYIDLNLEVQQVPFDELHDSLASQLVAGTGAPDMATIEVGQTSRFFIEPFASQFLDLNLPDEVQNNLARQEPYRDDSGRQTGIEVADAHPGFLYYRSDLFEEAGIEMPLETWDDYIDAGVQLMEETGYHLTAMGIQAESETAELTSLAIQNGNPIYDGQGNFALNDSNTLEVLERIVEAYELGILDDEYSDDSTLIQRYLGDIDEQVASFIMPNWYFNSRILPSVDEPVWRLAPAPRFEGTDNDSFTWGGTSIAVVESQTDYPELAEAFILYTLTTTNQLRKFELTNFLPVTQPALESSEFLEYTSPEIFGDQPVGQIYADAIDGLPGFSLGRNWPEIGEEIEATFDWILDDPQAWLDHIESFAEGLD